jgi:hypothetical protein
MTPEFRSTRTSGGAHVARIVSVLLLLVFGIGVVTPALLSSSAGASPVRATTSHYEDSADAGTLYAQGRAAGRSGSEGLVILDFGRPAVDGPASGTVDFDGGFNSFPTIEAATQGYVRGYFAAAPSDLHLDVAIGTNDSCGAGQPCGGVVCGCEYEPPSFALWGERLANSVEQVQSWTTSFKSRSGYSDTVTVMAGDDAEPGFDPEYENTFNLMNGYARAVGGYLPAMVDYGSADPGFWSEGQLLQIANGFAPNLAVPEIYSQANAKTWAALASYAKSVGTPLTFFGVLSAAPRGTGSQSGADSLVEALQPITGQNSIQWFSNIDP